MKKIVASLIAILVVSTLHGFCTAIDETLPRLPDSTLILVELIDVADRWDEIWSNRTVTRFQDQILADSGLHTSELPLLAGNRAVIAWVPGSQRRPIIPVALLEPPDLRKAHEILDGCSLTVRWKKGLVWVAPPETGEIVDRMIENNDPGLTDLLAIRQTGTPLTPGGLVRGRVNAPAFAEFLRSRINGTLPVPVEWLASLAAAELEAVRFAAFRRDLAGDELLTEAVLEYEVSELPAEVAAVLNPASSTPPMPAVLPEDTVIASAWRAETAACLPWLEYASSIDSDGPLRNFDLWLEDIETQTGRSIQDDILDNIGEHAWFMLMANPPRALLMLETKNGPVVEKSLQDLLSYLSEMASARTLGLIRPDPVQLSMGDETVYAANVDTLLGGIKGPAFTVTDDHLLIGTDPASLLRGIEMLRGKHEWGTSRAIAMPHAAVRIDFGLLADLLDLPACLEPLATLLQGLQDGSAGVWYEEGALRIRATARFR